MSDYIISAKPGDIYWEVPEYNKHERDKSWYIKAAIIGLSMAGHAIWTSNYLFFGILVLSAFIIFITDKEEPKLLPIILNEEGLYFGQKFYDYDELKNFSVIYKPKNGVKNLYFEFKMPLKQRLSVALLDQNPLVVRDFLLRFLTEDLDRTDQPTSEGLAKILKL